MKTYTAADEAAAYARQLCTTHRCHCGNPTANPWTRFCFQHAPKGPFIPSAVQMEMAIPRV